MRRWIALVPLAVLAGLGVLFATFGLHHDPQYIPDAMVGQAVPAELLPSLRTGTPTPLGPQLRGPTLVNFFFSTCTPCEEEAPALMALKAQGVRIIGVAYKEAPAKTVAFLDRVGDPFVTVLVDRDGRAAVDFGVSGAPETFLIGPDHRVLAKRSGALQPADAEAMLERVQAGGAASRR